MLPSAGLWRAVVHRSRADWPVVVAAWLLLTAAITLLAAGTLYADTVALGGLRRAILAAPPGERSVAARTYVDPADVGSVDRAVVAEIDGAFGSAGAEVARVATAGTFAEAGIDPGSVRDLTVIGSYERLAAHALLLGGRWPAAGADPVEGVVSEGAATAMGVAVGDRLDLVGRLGRRTEVAVEIVGTFRPDPADPYWRGERLDLDGVAPGDAFTLRGPIVVAEEDLLARVAGGELDVTWRAAPSIPRLRPDGVDALRVELERLPAAVEAAAGPERRATVTTGLPAILEDVGRSILVSRTGILLLTLQFAILAGYAVLLVAGMLVERRRAEAALLRSRGATAGHLAAMALGEALLIAAPAAALSPLLAVGLVQALGVVGPLADAGLLPGIRIDGSVVAVAAAAGTVSAIALTLPTLTSTTNVAGVRAAIGRQGSTTLPQRLGVDLALVVLAAVGLWQLRLYGAPLTRDVRGTLGIDPLLVAAPGIGLLAGAIVAIRIVPRVAEIGERLLGRRRGFVLPLGARQLARRPLRYTRAALLLMLATALGTFAVSHAATWTRSQGDQAAFQAAADVRIVTPQQGAIPGWNAAAAYRAVPGVVEATPVTRHILEAGRSVRGGEMLGIDPAAVARIATLPADEPGLPGILAELPTVGPEPAVVPIPGEPEAIVVTVDSDLEPVEGSPDLPPGALGIRVAVNVRDVDGRLQALEGPPAPLQGAGQEVVVPLAGELAGRPVRVAFPAAVQGIDVRIDAPEGSVLAGSITVRGLVATSSSEGAAGGPVPLEFDAGGPGWGWGRSVMGEADRRVESGPDPATVVIGDPAGREGPISGSGSDPGPTFRLRATAQAGPIPALAGRTFLERAGSAVGRVVEARAQGVPVTLRIVGEVGTFPPLDPDRPFVVVDAATLEQARFGEAGHSLAPEEWWLDIDPDRVADIAGALAREPFAPAEVIERGALTRSLRSDPVLLGVIGALVLGALAAMAFAAIGFVVSATVAASERTGEFALLQALGLSSRQLSAWLSIENAFLLVLGLAAGTVLGLGLAWLVLPFATLTPTGVAAVPRPAIVVPWESILAVGAGTAAVLVATVAVVTRQVPGGALARVLRARDE